MARAQFLTTFFAAILSFILAAPVRSAESIRVYIGTYTRAPSKGIYLADFITSTGELKNVRLAAEVKNPSFLAIHPNGRLLYAVSEVDQYADAKGGAVSAFAINGDGTLTLLNHQSSHGAGPCHVSLDREGKNALVANYGGGSVAALPIGADGRLAAASSVIQHEGKSINPQRQEGPHAHAINLDRHNGFALVPDLGLDKVLIYKFDPATGKLQANDPAHGTLAPGAGPRHLAFDPAGKHVYVINEMANTVTGFDYDAKKGALEEFQTVLTLPDGANVQNTTAEIVVHPSGEFLYGSNRGEDSIAMFAIDSASGRLAHLGNHPCGGRTPRNFAIDPTGKFLLSAHQDSSTIAVHAVDVATGRLAKTNHKIDIPTPVCIVFASR
jgi:6-phosphogluconolactonase